MKTKLLIGGAMLLCLANNGGCTDTTTDSASDARQTVATEQMLDNADRSVGMPRIVNFAQRKLLKNAYEDMDQTTLTYAYTQALDGKFVCLGQALGYGVSMGTQFTNPHRAEYHYGNSGGGNLLIDQPEPNGLFSPPSGEATIVDLIDPKTGQAHTVMFEPKLVTVPFELPSSAVEVPCPDDIDPSKVIDVKEASIAAMAK